MAESEDRPPTDQPILENEERKKKLKYLEFVQVAALYVVVSISSIYRFAKQNSGPLRPGVQTVEGTVKNVIGPVYDKLHDVPFHLLKFVDRKVEYSVIELDHRVPALLKEISRHTWIAAQKAPTVARELASEVRRSGFTHTAQHAYDKYEPTAKELYGKYEPVAAHYAVVAWQYLNQLPLFPHAAHIMVPTAAYWARKYNQAVAYGTGKGYRFSHYIPLVPIDRIAKTFGGGHGNAPLANGPQVERLAKSFEARANANGPHVAVSH